MSIISVSLSSRVLCFPTNSIFALLIAKIGMSVLMQTSVENWFLGDGSFTFSLSRRNGKSFQHISSLHHLKSCKTITSAWSAPTEAYLSSAGLVNAWFFFHSQWKPLHCSFSRCSQWDYWEICWIWTTQRLLNLSVLPLFFCLLHKKAQCHDVYHFLIKTHWFRIELDVSCMLLSASCFVKHLLRFPCHMIF